MKTKDMTVVRERIHLYLQRMYVTRPARVRKREYHRRVSPMVTRGGRSREIQNPVIKEA